MLDHVGLEVSDLARSRAFYEQALEPRGIGPLMEFEGAAGFGKSGERIYGIYGVQGQGPVLWTGGDLPRACSDSR